MNALLSVYVYMKSWFECEEGQDLIEYALIIGLVVLDVAVGGLGGFVVDAEGDFLVEAVDGGGGGVDQFEAREEAARFEDRDETLQVRGDIIVGSGEGMADAGLGGEVDDVGDAVAQEQEFESVPIADIARDDFDALLEELFGPVFF